MVLLTGVGQLELDVEAMQAGAADYLENAELNQTRLKASTRHALGKKRHDAELEQKDHERTRDVE